MKAYEALDLKQLLLVTETAIAGKGHATEHDELAPPVSV